MGLLEDAIGGWTGSALVWVGVVLAAPVLLPAVAPLVRPLAKGLVMGYLAMADAMKEAVAETREQLSDLVAEAQSDYATETTSTRGRSRKIVVSKE